MAKQTLVDLANAMVRLSVQVGAAQSDVKRQVAGTILADLSLRTPVDTSQAISNWQVTLGAPAQGVRAAWVPGVGGSTYSTSASENVRVGLEAMRNVQPGQPIFITNNLPYIDNLNRGTSRQAPAGFVQRAELLGRRQLITAEKTFANFRI